MSRSPLTTAGAVVDALERAPAVVIPLVREVPASLLQRDRPREMVRARACVHLAVVHAIFMTRWKRSFQSAPVITPYDPGEAIRRLLLAADLDESLERFVADQPVGRPASPAVG